ncbi:TonB-dependent receptor [Rhodanobacter sp. Soil772]|uniref:TonB-dependent receptor n=1 Tax=Rhodanobacter sp. Soil772 TaxID=1736406 RepID=UPI000701C864|nr:TonB-dependent receptor [Rhodanobacter sp. Soil772]KRE84704.1 TonB-dependent receptor [Rhodanobacter sp. Soil772]
MGNNKQMTRLMLSAAIAGILMSATAMAQDSTQDTSATNAPATARKSPQRKAADAKETTNLQQVVVTGSATGVKKIDASYTLTTATAEQIKLANPKSTADLLKIAPGLWPESTGGQTGANIEIAGFPGGGDAPYFSTQMMGSPLYGMPTLSFFETTSIFRLDDTVERVEILQGGPSVVFGDGQIGATANFILKQGTEVPSGSIGVTYGSENLKRVDGFFGFPVAENWYGSVGGFYRDSDGVRDPQFPADKGGQFTATLTHDSDRGTMMLYARALNDKNQFITPIPLIQNGTDNFSAYPGFDPLKDTYNSKYIQHVFLAGYPGGGTNADLANGRGAKMNFFGGNFDYDLGNGWTISDKFLIDAGDVDTNALFSGSNPATLNDELYNTPSSQGGFGLPAGSATATYAGPGGGGAVDPNQSVIHQGWWYIHKHLKNINNDFRLSKEIFEGNTLTAGVYLAHYTMDDKWALGNQMLMTNTPNARPIMVSYNDGGTTKQLTDNQGFLDNGGYNITERGVATNKAFYLSDSWRIGQWLFDASARLENQDASNTVCNLTNVDLDGNPLTLYNNGVPVCNGTFARTNYDKTHTSWTVGANYQLADNMSVYVRGNKGVHFGDFDNAIRGFTTGNTAPLQKIQNIEAGFKYQSELVYADISVYHKQFNGLTYQPTDGAGKPVGTAQLYGSDSKGINLSGTLTPVENLKLSLVANYLDGHYTHNSSCFIFTNVVTGETGCAPINGKQLQRQPKVRYMFTPSYRIPFAWGDVTAFVTYTHVGPHTQDQSGLQQLGTYHTYDFGVIANIEQNWQVRLQGTNITNELGLTESNSRIFGTAVSGGVILARPLEGREINFQVKYLF